MAADGGARRSVLAVASILLIEDDSGIRLATTRALTDLGHAVTTSNAGMPGLNSAVDNPPDVVLLDLGLPDVDGLQVLAMLRAVSEVPVIIITARDDDADIVKALDAGADDYVVKPFAIGQVEARIRAVLRRSGSAVAEGSLVVGGLRIDARTRQVSLDGQPVDLSRKEFDLLLALAHRPGEVVTKRELLADVWRQSYGGGDRTVDVHLSWLRRKLGETAADPRYLHSVRGVGVRLVAPDVVAPDPAVRDSEVRDPEVRGHAARGHAVTQDPSVGD
jgi:DNA-binding response OmpR family regulator